MLAVLELYNGHAFLAMKVVVDVVRLASASSCPGRPTTGREWVWEAEAVGEERGKKRKKGNNKKAGRHVKTAGDDSRSRRATARRARRATRWGGHGRRRLRGHRGHGWCELVEI
jgi:hypothetical protein